MGSGVQEARPSAAAASPRPTSALELAFVVAPRQNAFFLELIEALADELHALGVATSLHVGDFPAPRPELVYVLIPPHEYFTLTHGRRGPSPETLARTIYVCAEQPGTSFFEDNVALAPRCGALFDINRHAVAAFARRGLSATHLQIGWTQRWDQLRSQERDIDVLFFGCVTGRRSRALAHAAKVLQHRAVRFVLSDNSAPNWRAAANFMLSSEKWELLNRTKVLLNIHQGDSPYFEWLRIVQAISNGAVVVSEHSVDHAPLLAGRHFLTGDADSLGYLAEFLLEDSERRWEIQTEAYRMLTDGVRLGSAAAQLAEAGRGLLEEPLPDPTDPHFHQRPMPATVPSTGPDQPPDTSFGDPNASVIRRALKDVKLEQVELRRRLARLEYAVATGALPAPLALGGRTHAWAAAAPRVSVLTALFNHEEQITDALDSLLASTVRDWELIVVDDGSTDGSSRRVLDWMRAHEDAAVLLLRHPVNRGLGAARNSALGWARGEFCFILDADNEIYPRCFDRLATALRDDGDAAFAYGMHERFTSAGAQELINIFPWEPERLRTGNYIDAMAMIRTTLLRERFGGYTTNRRLHGWEDYDLWCSVAEEELHGAFVPEVVARYRSSEHSMLSLTNISSTEAFSVLIERHPKFMAGVRPPS